MTGRDPQDDPDRDSPPEPDADPASEPARADSPVVGPGVWGEPNWDDLPQRAGGVRRGKGGRAAGRRAASQLVDRLRWTGWALVYRAAGLASVPGDDSTLPPVGRRPGDAPSVPEPGVPAIASAGARRAGRGGIGRRSKGTLGGGDNPGETSFAGPAGFPTDGPVVALARRLARLPVGLYAVRYDPLPFDSTPADQVNPAAAAAATDGRRPSAASGRGCHLLLVTDALIATSLRRLADARRFPRWLPKLVGDVPAWRAAAERQLTLARRAADAAAGLAGQAGAPDDSTSPLALEASCLWLGPDRDRPSARSGTDPLSRRLFAAAGPAGRSRRDPSAAAAEPRLADQAAAVLLGSRGVVRSLPAGLDGWRAAGASLRSWPPDLLMAVARALGSPAALAALAAECSLADESAARAVAWSALLAGEPAEVSGIATAGSARRALELVRLAAGVADRIGQEVDRRFGRLAEARRSAVDGAVVASRWRPDEPSPEARHRQSAIFEGVYNAMASAAIGEAAAGQVDQVRGTNRRLQAAWKQRPAVARQSTPAQVLAGWSGDCLTLCQAALGDAAAFEVGPGVLPSPAADPTESMSDSSPFDPAGRAADVVFRALAGWRAVAGGERADRVAALAGRLMRAGVGAAGPSADAVQAWADACCRRTRPGRFGRGHWVLATRGFSSLAAAARRAGDPDAFWRALADHADAVLEAAAARLGLDRGPGRTPEQWPTGKAGVALAVAVRAGLSPAEVAAAVRGPSAHLLAGMSGATPDRLRATHDWLRRLAGTSQTGPVPIVPSNWAPRYGQRVDLATWAGLALAQLDGWLFARLTAAATPPAVGPQTAAGLAGTVLGFLLKPSEGSTDGSPPTIDRAWLLARQRFLRTHPYLLDPLLGPARDPGAATLDPASWRSFAEVAYEWHEQGGSRPAEFWRALVGRRRPDGTDGGWSWPVFDYVRAEERPALMRLSGGDVGRAMVLADASPDLAWRQLEAAARAAKWAANRPDVLAALSPLTGESATVNRLLRWLARLDLCLRLPDAGRTADALRHLAAVATESATAAGSAAEAGRPVKGLAAEGSAAAALPADVTPMLAAVAALNGGAAPKRIRQVVGREAQLRAELRALERRPAGDPAIDRRRENVARYLADPAALAEWVAADLRKALPTVLGELLLSAVEREAEAAVARHTARLLGRSAEALAAATGAAGADWDNAVRLYFSIEHNRPLLLRLMRHRAAGDAGWVERHPPNARFLAGVAGRGVDVAAWRGRFRRSSRTPAGRLTVALEADPLHVLQMGNYFGTCLGEHGINAFSAVANACEANRRVAYVRDARGRVVGRKLLVMTPGGRIAGFQSYGSGRHEVLEWFGEAGDDEQEVGGGRGGADGHAEAAVAAGNAPVAAAAAAPVAAKPPARRGRVPSASPWVKVALDAFCRDLSDRCRAPLHPFPDEVADDPVNGGDDLKLFARWYHDGCESFDRWWVRHAGTDLRSAARAGVGPIADAVVTDLRMRTEGALRQPYYVQERFAEAVRLVLWLGDDAVPLLRRVREAGPLPRPLAVALDRYAVGVAVRTWAAGAAASPARASNTEV